ncbi:MAG TPA: GAF domain-containing protein [Methylomirabilota bacterium]|nr:GAF domain-containing protein [Methylomirabilota bacterium]
MSREPRPTRSPAPGVALMAQATRALGGTLDLGRLVKRLTEIARAHLAAEAAGVWLLERGGAELALRGDVGFKRPEVVARLAHPPGRDVLGWISDRPGPLVLRRLPIEARPEVRRWLEVEELRSCLGVPLLGDAAPVGALALFRRSRRVFTRADLARAETLCIPAAPAILNARLYAEQLGRAERTEILLSMAEALGATLDLPASLADLSQRAARALDAEHCAISLWPGGTVPADAPLGDAEAALRRRPVEVDDTFLVVPIVRKGEAIGVLRLSARVRRRWERSAVDLASAIAGQIALVAENARLYQEAQAQASELTVLREVGTTLTSTLDLPTVLDAVVAAVLRLSGARQCAVLELDPADQRLHVRAQGGFTGSPSGVSLALGQGAAGTAAQTRAPFFNGDLARTPLPLDDVTAVTGIPLSETVRRDEMRAALAVPLISKQTVLGAISVFWGEPRTHDPREVRLLTGVAQQAAVAIEQARLHGGSVRRAEELAALLRAVRTVMGGLDTKTTLESIVREAAAIAGTPHVKLLLLDRESSTLRLAAQVGHPIPADVAVPLGESYSGRVALTGEPVFIADTSDDLASLLAARDRESGIVTYLGLPVRIRDTVLGVLTFHTDAPRRYSADELAYLGSFADQAAIALDNARLYEDTQRALSDLRTMQRKLVQGETLRALGELAGGAAHHLNNLLTIVVGRIQLLRRIVEEERLARPLEIIERAAKDGAEVVRRLQQFAGMRRTAEPRTVDLGQIATDVLEMTRGRWQDAARAQGTEIVVESRLTPLAPVPGDAAALREMLTNLVLNAVDALPRGGRLTVEAGPSEGGASLTVTDTGLGMPEEVRLRAHEPFFTTKGVKATGLGLSVAFGIARRHGGELSIQSEEGRGTTVRVTLPLPPGAAVPAHPPPALPRRALRVLLVDDEEEVRTALAEMLATRGHTVLEAGGGAEALRRLAEEQDVDLVLTDLVMPAMTGWELAGAVKARRPGLPVGVVTGWGDVPEATPGSRTAVDFVLSKPVTFEALDQALGRI